MVSPQSSAFSLFLGQPFGGGTKEGAEAPWGCAAKKQKEFGSLGE